MKKPHIAIVLGTAREGRQSEHAAKYLLESLGKRDDMTVELVDVRDHLTGGATIPAWVESEKTAAWKQIAEKADGYIMIVPEYNHGYPGELKLLLDSAYKEYEKKPVLVASVSAGGFGGVRVIDHMMSVFYELQMIPVNAPLIFGKAEELFKKQKDEIDEQYSERINKSMNTFLSYF